MRKRSDIIFDLKLLSLGLSLVCTVVFLPANVYAEAFDTVSEDDIGTAPLAEEDEEELDEENLISDNGKSMDVTYNATVDNIPDSVQVIMIRSGCTLTVNGSYSMYDKYLEIEEGGALHIKGNLTLDGGGVPGSYYAGRYGQEQAQAWAQLPSWGIDRYGLFTKGREGRRVAITIDGDLIVNDDYNGLNGANTDLYVGGNVIGSKKPYITLGHYTNDDAGSTMTVKGSVIWNANESPTRLYIEGNDPRCMTVYGDIIDQTYGSDNQNGDLEFDNLYLPTPGSMCINAYPKYSIELEGPKTMYMLYPTNITSNLEGQGIIEKDAAFNADAGIRMFVCRMYAEVFDRTPDKDGLDYWTGSLKDKSKKGADIAEGFILSDEFLYNNNLNCEEYIRLLYKVFFDRQPSDAEVESWKVQMLREQKGKKYVLAGFVNSVEFENLCKRYGIEAGHMEASTPIQVEVTKMNVDATDVGERTIEQYVNNFYLLLLGRPAEWEGLNYWTKNIISGEKYDAASAIKVGIIESEEFKNLDMSDMDFLYAAYYGFFDREPDDEGYRYWIRKMAEGTYTKSSVIEVGFGRSQEFKNKLIEIGFKVRD